MGSEDELVEKAWCLGLRGGLGRKRKDKRSAPGAKPRDREQVF